MNSALATPVITDAAISHGRLVNTANMPHPADFSTQPAMIIGLYPMRSASVPPMTKSPSLKCRRLITMPTSHTATPIPCTRWSARYGASMRRAIVSPISLTNRICAGRPKDLNCRRVAITRHLRAGPGAVRGRPPSGHPDAPPAVTPASPAGGRPLAGVHTREGDIAPGPPESGGRVLSPTFPLLSPGMADPERDVLLPP